MPVLKFLASRSFLKTLLFLVVLTAILTWLTMKLISVYTRHNSELQMPDVRGYLPSELADNASFNRYRYIVIDSVYDSNKPKGSIVSQDPFPASMVKKGRKVYLTVVAMTPEQVDMPDLSDLSLRQARSILETYGLRLGVLSFVPDIGKTVIEQRKNNKLIESGQRIEKGSRIDLVMGEGTDRERVLVPMIVGKSYEDAIASLQLAGLNIGQEVYMDGKKNEEVRVFRQHPRPNFKAQKGARIDLWYRSTARFDFDNYLNTYNRDSLYVEPETEILE